jgi:L-asparaginase
MLLVSAAALAMCARMSDAQTTDSGKGSDSLPRVAILATGGTIAGKASGPSQVGYTSGQVTAQDLIAGVPGIEKLARISAEQISNIGSQDMNDEVWFTLAHRINELFEKGEADGVVITHGTDTMEETAFFLEQVVASDKPVVLVGSMRPSTAVSADGPANLYAAVKLAASKEGRGRGTMIVLNDTIHESRDGTKTHTTSVQTFDSPNAGPAGFINAAAIAFVEPAPEYVRPRFRLPEKAPLPRVDIIYSHANMLPDEVTDALKRGAKGLVLAGVGDGNSSKAVIEALAEAAKKGIPVVRSTRVGSGFIVRNAELNDDELGFVTALDLNPPKARVLLQLLLANNITDAGRIQQEFGIR